ncbi:MAG: TIGR03087 family PEP-CTERM/XrtA system glycosyltransferase [Planctomycetes bacterium]|nr:TIGR03087 family PEP-CTERM/XrtA system glycosyltransferase [Planctomycetota bacterium]
MDLLFVCHRFPYPPDKGDKIRSWRFLDYLAARHRVRVVAAADDPADLAHVGALQSRVEAVRIVPFGRAAAARRAAYALATGRPLSVAWFPVGGLRAAARRLVRARRPDGVLAYSAQVAPAAFALGVPVVLDLVDRDSAKWAQYGAWLSPPRRWIYALEARRLARAEERWIERAAATLVISAHEKSLFPDRLAPRLNVVRNPVRLESFSTDRSQEQPHTILFAGALDYWPNRDAVSFYAREVMPRVRAAVPDAEFHVVGPRAPAALTALAGRHGVRFLGYVADIRAVYARAAVSVAPFRFTQGALNKVIEAMASAIPVVATPRAVRGLEVAHGEGAWLGETATELAAHTIALLGDPAARRRLGTAGRRFVAATLGWPGDLPRLDALLEAAFAPASINAAVR